MKEEFTKESSKKKININNILGKKEIESLKNRKERFKNVLLDMCSSHTTNTPNKFRKIIFLASKNSNPAINQIYNSHRSDKRKRLVIKEVDVELEDAIIHKHDNDNQFVKKTNNFSRSRNRLSNDFINQHIEGNQLYLSKEETVTDNITSHTKLSLNSRPNYLRSTERRIILTDSNDLIIRQSNKLKKYNKYLPVRIKTNDYNNSPEMASKIKIPETIDKLPYLIKNIYTQTKMYRLKNQKKNLDTDIFQDEEDDSNHPIFKRPLLGKKINDSTEKKNLFLPNLTTRLKLSKPRYIREKDKINSIITE